MRVAHGMLFGAEWWQLRPIAGGVTQCMGVAIHVPPLGVSTIKPCPPQHGLLDYMALAEWQV